MREESEAVEVVCPVCNETEIVYLPREQIPECPKCHRPMVIKELLDEGKSY
ncbi:MAG: hypothetical protein JW821_05945 [Deltaproteobacteria bacterium]|nr:hypothetical protein [Deltaproteobacteria bacterium]